MSGPLLCLTLAAALGSGLIAGVFLAFSGFVMKALARLPAPQGVAAMQSINVVAVTPPLMVALFATALACLALVISAPFTWNEPAVIERLLGALAYLAGVILLTVVYHVPRNDALASIDPSGTGAAQHWRRYVAGWTAWNHIRAAAAFGAAATLSVALL